MPDAKLTMPADDPGQGPRDHQAPAAGGRPIPLRLAPGRFWLWSVGLVFMSGIIIVGAPWNGWVDFPQFWLAAKVVGTPDLLDTVRQQDW